MDTNGRNFCKLTIKLYSYCVIEDFKIIAKNEFSNNEWSERKREGDSVAHFKLKIKEQKHEDIMSVYV